VCGTFGQFSAPRRTGFRLRNTLLTLIEVPGSTLLSVSRMLDDARFREHILTKVSDPVVRSFWLREFASMPPKLQAEAVSPIYNKVGQLVSNPLLRNILGQSRSTLDLRKVMDEGKVLLVNLSKGRIGEDASALLGAFLVTAIQQAAMSRADTREQDRPDFYLFIDEFQNFATEAFAAILSEARKYRLNLVVANQYLDQIDDATRSAVFGNVGSMISFAVGVQDAEVLAEQLGGDLIPKDLMQLPRYQAYARLLIDGQPSRPFTLRTLPPVSPARGNEHRPVTIRRYCRQRYGRPIAELSFKTLTRFSPSCIIELTATPETKHNPAMQTYASNILYHVSARELKEAEMIKLPVKLRTRPDWKQVLGDAIAKRKELEALADANEKVTGEYLRPIMLIQAQPQNKNKPTLTVEVVKQALMNDHQIPEEQIAIATGQTRELDDVDLFGRNPIRFIITVQALKEGWDCSFAYVLCSLAEQHSARSVEQILGRVLRMPRAKKKNHPDLNVAYAYAAAASWFKTAEALQDAMIESGFHQLEAKDFVIGPAAEQGTFDDLSMFGTTAETVSEAPDLANLDPALRDRVTFDDTTKALTVVGILSESEYAALDKCFTTLTDKKAVARLRERAQGKRTASEPAADRKPIRVPWLSVRVGGQLELFDQDHFLTAPWDLAKCEAALSEKEFPSSWSAGDTGEIDITKAGKVELTHFVTDLHEQISLITGESGWEVATLARWLDRNIRHPDIPQLQSSCSFIGWSRT
jgi:hypothetical protein